MRMAIKVTNIYEDGDQVVRTKAIDVPEPEPDDDMEQWAEDHIFEHTGTGRAEGDAAYFVEVVECHDQPHLKGTEFEWGT
jgi:hypothetical protein